MIDKNKSHLFIRATSLMLIIAITGSCISPVTKQVVYEETQGCTIEEIDEDKPADDIFREIE